MCNYLLIRDESWYIRIHEVFYTKKWKIWWWSESIDLGGMKRKDILADLEYIVWDIKKSEILGESWIRENLAKPKWLNPSKKELSKAMTLEEFEEKMKNWKKKK